MIRGPSVYATVMSTGETVAMIINWKEVKHSHFSFSLEEIGIVMFPGQQVQVTDLWSHEVVGTYDQSSASKFEVPTINGHGNFTYRFTVINKNLEAVIDAADEIQEVNSESESL